MVGPSECPYILIEDSSFRLVSLQIRYMMILGISLSLSLSLSIYLSLSYSLCITLSHSLIISLFLSLSLSLSLSIISSIIICIHIPHPNNNIFCITLPPSSFLVCNCYAKICVDFAPCTTTTWWFIGKLNSLQLKSYTGIVWPLFFFSQFFDS